MREESIGNSLGLKQTSLFPLSQKHVATLLRSAPCDGRRFCEPPLQRCYGQPEGPDLGADASLHRAAGSRPPPYTVCGCGILITIHFRSRIVSEATTPVLTQGRLDYEYD